MHAAVKKRSLKKLRKFDRAAGPRSPGRIIVFDLEATCWETERPDSVEILEIGAVKLDVNASGHGMETGEFSSIVRPVSAPQLSEFCLGLVPIRQADADAADPFAAVFARWISWIGAEPFWLASWGTFDRAQLSAECRRNDVTMPTHFLGHINVRREFARWKHVRPPGLAAAMEACELTMEGTAHRALDDARNLARLARILVGERATGRG